MKKILLATIIIVGAAVFLWNRNVEDQTGVRSTDETNTGSPAISFESPKKSAHYESNTPEHAAVLPGTPVNVVINFNFDLAVPSSMKIVHEGKDYGAGETVIDENKLTMRRAMDPASPDGVYRVEYRACWPDRSCHDGYFQFAIDRKLADKAVDLRNRSSIEIDLAEIAFVPENFKVSRDTKIVWKNSDSVVHYINTDSHPGHTYYPAQNSNALNKNDTYAVVFDKPGVYPYHCSAHADVMKGMIIVEE